MKGADHLVPIAERLVARGIDFRFDVFGVGSLGEAMREAASRAGLAGRLTVQGPLDFDTELVPRMTSDIDLFVCCHRQSDPSCTYMETLGCGVPIVGYRNRAIEGIIDVADVGWLVPMDDLDAMVNTMVALDSCRQAIITKARTAIAFAADHSFESTFARRVAHLQAVALRNRRHWEQIAI
jgi:glycosyltransferase involved in cell wall biosynthesis